MFNFSANHLFLIKRIESRSCFVFLMQDRFTGRLYRLYDFSKSRSIAPEAYYCVAGKVNSANNQLYLVIESIRADTKHPWTEKAVAPPESAGGESLM